MDVTCQKPSCFALQMNFDDVHMFVRNTVHVYYENLLTYMYMYVSMTCTQLPRLKMYPYNSYMYMNAIHMPRIHLV